jgi:hypothetical protein
MGFSLEVADYEPKCAKCHRAYDGQFGEGHHQAKLTVAQVRDARVLYRPRTPGYDTYALARRFGVSQRTMARVLSGVKPART